MVAGSDFNLDDGGIPAWDLEGPGMATRELIGELGVDDRRGMLLFFW